jgi:hypothetical protein
MQTENIYPTATAQVTPSEPPAVMPQAHQFHPEHTAVNVNPFPSVVSTPPSPPPQPTQNVLSDTGSDKPVPVLEVLSVRGVEYGMMTIVLWIGALTLAWIFLNMLNGSRGFNYLVVPTSALVVCVPIFAWFFLRLKKAELVDPGLRLDPSKRRWSQITQILAYTAVLINLIYFVYVVLQHTTNSHGSSIPKAFGNLLVILLIAGGILAYYWRDEHRLIK